MSAHCDGWCDKCLFPDNYYQHSVDCLSEYCGKLEAKLEAVEQSRDTYKNWCITLIRYFKFIYRKRTAENEINTTVT